MKRAQIQDFASPGFVADQPDLNLPSGAWTDSRNVRYRDGAVEKCRGYASVFGSLSATAIWACPVNDGSNVFWAYGSGSVMYATDGSTHATINGTVTISATADLGYTGGQFNGFLVISDGSNIPQTWSPSLGNDLVSLTAWPALTLTCEVIRPWRNFLVALRIKDGSTLNPRLMRWSDAAASGALPGSWDYADPTNQAGIKEFGESDDLLVDCEPLRDNLVIYKGGSTWLGEYVGGVDVIGFRQIFTEVGALSQDCIGPFGTQHIVLTADDLILHDGNSAQSLLDKRARRWLFNRIDTTYYKRCFVSMDYRAREAWICFPETGQQSSSMALVWNWAENTFHPFDLGGQMSYGISGQITGTGSTFDADTGTFNEGVEAFDAETVSPFRRGMVLLAADGAKALQMGTAEGYDGRAMSCYAERTGTLITEDLGTVKRVWRLWPRVDGTQDDILTFWIGAREALSGPVAYSGPYDFTIGEDNWIDVRFNARIIDLRVEYSGLNSFRLFGLGIDYEDDGDR